MERQKVTRGELDKYAEEFGPMAQEQGFNMLKADNKHYQRMTYAHHATENAFTGFVMAKVNASFQFRD